MNFTLLQNTSHGNEVLPQDITHLMQRPCYEWRSPCQDPAGNQTTRRPDHRKEMQTEVVWTCLPYIRSSQNHLARHSERGKKTRQTEDNIMEWTGLEFTKSQRAVENREKWRKLCCEIICGVPMTLVVKGLIMMIMIMTFTKPTYQTPSSYKRGQTIWSQKSHPAHFSSCGWNATPMPGA